MGVDETDLLEATSAQFDDGTALAVLEAALRQRGVEIRFDPERRGSGRNTTRR